MAKKISKNNPLYPQDRPLTRADMDEAVSIEMLRGHAIVVLGTLRYVLDVYSGFEDLESASEFIEEVLGEASPFPPRTVMTPEEFAGVGRRLVEALMAVKGLQGDEEIEELLEELTVPIDNDVTLEELAVAEMIARMTDDEGGTRH